MLCQLSGYQVLGNIPTQVESSVTDEENSMFFIGCCTDYVSRETLEVSNSNHYIEGNYNNEKSDGRIAHGNREADIENRRQK